MSDPDPQMISAGGNPSEAPSPEFKVGGLGLALLNAIGEGVALLTRTGAFVWANEPVKRLGGAMQERIGGACRLFDRDHPVLPPGVALAPGYVLPHAEVAMTESDRWFEIGISLPPEPGVTMGIRADWVLVVVRDVTPAKRLQQKINAIDQAGSELVRFDAELVRKYNAHERLKLLETKIVGFARNLLHFDHFAIRLLDERTGKLELVIGCNLPAAFDSFVIKPGLDGFGISGYVAASGRSYVCVETSADALYLPGVEGARSSLTVPLRLQDKVIGIMNVESLSPAAFGDEERQLGEIFARYVAVAIHMLDLLVVERSSTNQTITGRVASEIKEPLEDIAHEVEQLRSQIPSTDPGTASHLERINADLAAIRQRILECAAGPSSLLGVEKAMAEKTIDPIIAGRTVLVADDELRIRKTIGDVLTLRGAKVTICEDGGSAIRILDESPPGAFDLVVSDIRLPDHNGYEIFAAAKRNSANTPVILMTGFGYDPHHSIVRASQEGLQTVLFKPFQVERLLEDVRKAILGKV